MILMTLSCVDLQLKAFGRMTHRVSDIAPPAPGIVRDAGRQNRTIGGIFHRNGSLLHPAAAGKLGFSDDLITFNPSKNIHAVCVRTRTKQKRKRSGCDF